MKSNSRGAIKWSALVLYVLVLPAALQLLARLDEYFEFTGLIGRLLRMWESFIHGLWERLLALLPQWVDLAANQIDAITWCVATREARSGMAVGFNFGSWPGSGHPVCATVGQSKMVGLRSSEGSAGENSARDLWKRARHCSISMAP